MFGPTRGGTRGGQGLFKWEDVKEDKYRENYLGHSLLAPVGRWQKNKDLQWYSKGEEGARQQQEAIAAELEEIKQSEADALAEALGYAGPKRRKKDDNSISRKDIESLVKKDLLDSGAVEETQRVEEPKGLGFQSTKARIAAVGMIKDKPGHEESSVTPPAVSENGNSMYSAEKSYREDDQKRSRKSEKKDKRKDREKKERKKKTKSDKKERKEKKETVARSRKRDDEEANEHDRSRRRSRSRSPLRRSPSPGRGSRRRHPSWSPEPRGKNFRRSPMRY